MKKTLLTMLALAAAVVSQAALPEVQSFNGNLQPQGKQLRQARTANQQMRVAKAEEETPTGRIQFCADQCAGELGFGQALNYTVYIAVPTEMTALFDGVKITSITTEVVSEARNTIPAKIFVSTSMDKFDYEQSSDLNAKMNAQGYGVPTTIQLDEPFVVDGSKPLYFGYQIDALAKDWPIPCDKAAYAGDGLGGYITVSNGQVTETYNLDELGGYGNIWMYATFEGEMQQILIPAVSFIGPDKTFMTMKPGSLMQFEVDLKNNGSITLTDYEVYVAIDDETPSAIRGNFKNGVAMGAVGTDVEQTYIGSEPGRHNIKFWVTKVNGESFDFDANAFPIYSYPFYVVPEDVNYTQRFVCEEFTGTWCGWCPMGFVGLEQMNEKYPDTFIGMPVHYNDQFQSDAYMPLLQKFAPYFPSMAVNRDPIYIGIQPSPQVLPIVYNMFDTPAFADVKLTADFDGTNPAKATCDVTFACDEEDAGYKIAFAVMEQKLRGSQTNYYAGGANGAMGGWESKGETATVAFPETAINIYNVWGLSNSVPTSITGGETISFTYDVPMTVIKKVENAVIVALLLDSRTGVIVNAAKVDYAAGVKGIEADKAMNVIAGKGMITVDGNATVYNLAGCKVAAGQGSIALPAGLYLVNVNGAVYKVVVR